jgi:hypothetical protein
MYASSISWRHRTVVGCLQDPHQHAEVQRRDHRLALGLQEGRACVHAGGVPDMFTRSIMHHAAETMVFSACAGWLYSHLVDQ